MRLKRHDSILIDGTRGIGKTTLIEKIKLDSQLCKSVYILKIIDPNQLDKKTNILDIIISNIFESLKAELRKKDAEYSSEYSDICNLKQKIDKTIFDTEKKNYEGKQYESISNKYATTISEMNLDRIIHEFAYKVCKILKTDALVLPIDDIDMKIDLGNDIVETLRKYLQTPRIIPVIALDAAQIYALVKKSYFEQFNFEAKTPLSEIDFDSELSFLKKLPSEYIQKILPPSQRIVLPDMLGHYINHLTNKKTVFFEYTARDIKNSSGASFEHTFKLRFDELLKLIMSILFEYDGENIKNPEATDYHVINYLKNKTFRSFIDDARSIFQSLDKENEDGSFIVNRQRLKERFKMYSKNHSSNKYDSALWFWTNYTNKLIIKMKKNEKRGINKKSSLKFN